MGGPDPDTLKRGEKIGKSAASPLVPFLRAAGLVDVNPVPVGLLRAAGTLKKISVVAGLTTVADTGVGFALSAFRGGSPAAIWSGTLGDWTALEAVELSSATADLLENDVVFWQVTGAGAASLPWVLLLVEVEL